MAVTTLPAVASEEPARGVSDLRAHEVDTIWTDEFGVARPTGIAYDATRQELLVGGAEEGRVLRLGPDRESRGTRSGDGIDLGSGPRIEAVNPSDGLLYVLAAGRLDAVDDGDVVASYDMSSLDLSVPVGMTFAPTTDATDAPANVNLFVADRGSRNSFGNITEVTLAQFEIQADIDASVIQTIHTSAWTPGSPDPAGVAYLPGPLDRLIVIDSEVDEQTGAGFHDVNMWFSTRSGSVTQTGTTSGPMAANGGYSNEPTGASYDSASNTLFISDDSGGGKIWVVKPGMDGIFGNSDDAVSQINTLAMAANDVEDPAFDPVSGHLFFVSGVDAEIYRIDPVDGIFGNGNDTFTQFDIGVVAPVDYEGLALSPTRESLFVGARADFDDTHKIFEITYDGVLINTIDVTEPTLTFISGLELAPSSIGGQTSLWIVDRAVDNGPDPLENDGKLFEISVPGLDEPVGNLPPHVDAGPDLAGVSRAGTTVTGVVTDDGLPGPHLLSYSWSQDSGPGVATFATPGAASTDVAFSEVGQYVLRLTADDGQFTSFDTVTVTVVNTAPTIAAIGDQQVTVGGSLVVPVTASDPDGDDLSISVEGADFVSYDPTNGNVVIAPQPGDAGERHITVTAADGELASGEAPAFRSASTASLTAATGSTLAVAKPNGTAAGDLMLAHVRYRGDIANLTTPTGWIVVGSVLSNNNAHHTVLYKFASTSEPASYTFDQNVSEGRMSAAIAAYSGVEPTAPVDVWAASEANAVTLTAPAIDTTVDNATVVRLWGWRSAATDSGALTVSAPSGLTERWTAQTGGGTPTDRNRILGADHVQAAMGAVAEATASGDDAAKNNRSSFSLALAPEIGGLSAATTFTLTVQPVTEDPTDPEDPEDPEDPIDPEDPEDPTDPQDWFIDDNGHLFETDINGIATAGITRGCNPPVNDRFCPDDTVTRGQMAAFLVRALGYGDEGGGDHFGDTDGSIFAADIDRLAAAGVTRGCNPPANDRFCPDDQVTRGQMAAFLVRALGYTDDGGGNSFVDDDHTVFEDDIARLAAAGVTRGCNPPVNDRFCPDDYVTRGQMAAFLARALLP